MSEFKINVTHVGTLEEAGKRKIAMIYDIASDTLAISTLKKNKKGDLLPTAYRIPFRDKLTGYWALGQGISKSSSHLAVYMQSVEHYLSVVRQTKRQK